MNRGPGRYPGNVMAMSNFAGDIDAELGEPFLPSGVHLDMPDFADIDNVSQVPECVSFGEPGSGTISPESGNVMVMSDFAGDIDAELGEPFLPSGVHLDMPDFADVDNVSQVPDCVSFIEPGSGTVSPESGNVMAMSNFSGDIDAEPGEPFLPSGVHLDMPDFADVGSVSRGPDCVSSGEPGSGTVSPGSGSVMAMSDFVSDFDPGPDGPLLGSAVMFGRVLLVTVNKCRRGTACIP